MADRRENSKTRILTYQNYLTMIRNSRGSQMFRRLYVSENNKKKDILRNGELSCAYYVSSILKIFDLISEPHTTVKKTLKDMSKNGWRPTKKLTPGNILVWEDALAESDRKFHSHLGFYLGGQRAISNQGRDTLTVFRKTGKIKFVLKGEGSPKIHHFSYGQTKSGQPKRKITQILTHPMIK